MHASELPDWRVAKAARVATSSASSAQHGPKPGDIVLLVSVTEAAGTGEVTFPTPSPPSLALNSCIAAARSAATLRTQLRFKAAPGIPIAVENWPTLFDYFEFCMVAVAFSYQSLESFANQIISDHLTGTFVLKRRNGAKAFNAPELERGATTEASSFLTY